ncbi:hypothetical protein HJ590_15215 [Naumannella sp. ID2617S]|nr:hypothetical protein [Naumannella sp. ID2617S]
MKECVARYERLARSEAPSFTWVGGQARELVKSLLPPPQSPLPERMRLEGFAPVVYNWDACNELGLLADSGDWLVLYEENGFWGPFAAPVTEQGGTLVNVYWNVNAQSNFSVTVDGRDLARLELLWDPDESMVPDGELRARLQRFPFVDGSWNRAAGLAAAAEYTSTVLDEQ